MHAKNSFSYWFLRDTALKTLLGFFVGFGVVYCEGNEIPLKDLINISDQKKENLEYHRLTAPTLLFDPKLIRARYSKIPLTGNVL